MIIEFFTMPFFKCLRNQEDLKIKEVHKTPKLKPCEYTPKTIERLRKIQSSEDFMKIQVPWIL